MIDTHCHIFKEYYDNIDEIINKMGNNIIIISGTNDQDNQEVLDLCKKYPNVYGTIGIHPTEEYSPNSLKFIEENLNNEKIVGIGEIGLDYYWEKDINKRKLQKIAFIKQIEIANNFNLPIVIHTREAVMDTLEILKNNEVIKKGVFHCCPLNIELIKEALKLGYYISFAGPITFKNSKNAEDVINLVPLDRMLIETDSPYLSPEPNRGKRNDSRNVIYMAQKIADIRKKSLEEIAKITYENTCKIFNII